MSKSCVGGKESAHLDGFVVVNAAEVIRVEWIELHVGDPRGGAV